MLNLDRSKEEEICTQLLGAQSLITAMDFLQENGYNDFEILAPGRNSSFFRVMT